MAKKEHGSVDTVMRNVPAVPGFASSPGEYNEGSGVGPKGVDGGIPLKFIDTSIKAPGTDPVSTTLTALPAQTRTK